MTRSVYFRFRTGASGLSDNELLLLDRLFDGIWYPLTALYEEDFALHANLAFSHGFSNATVRMLLTRWHRIGWLERNPEERFTYYSLTPAGGVVWERERRPIWDRYCLATSGPYPQDPGEPCLLSVASPSLRVAEAFLATANRIGLYDAPIIPHTLTRRYHRDWDELSWKTLPRVVELRGVLQPEQAGAVSWDWDLYEKEQVWWRTPEELFALRLKGIE